MTPNSPQIITLNGEAREVQARNVAQLLEELQMPNSGIAVARNGSVVRRAEHAQTPVETNDNIEIIRAVQGG